MERDKILAGQASTLTAAALLLIALVLAAGVLPGPGQAETVDDSTTTVDQTFTEAGGHIYTVPAGVNNIDVELIGGEGADRGSVPGGDPARVSGRIAVSAETNLFMLVGGNATGTAGGVNGGGDAQPNSLGAATGGGGGGASDIRTVNPDLVGTLASRIVVAAGGGGAGATANGGGKEGGAGGDAGVAGVRAESAGPGNSVGSGGYGGGVGGSDAPGSGGAAGFPYGGPGTGQTGTVGQPGSLGNGGQGGTGPNNTPAGWGGGGGGGIYGGGGGGGGGTMTGGTPTATGGGGGGGGSFLVPPAGESAIETSGISPRVHIEFTIPGTEILTGPAEFTDSTTADFTFESTEPNSLFQCQVDENASNDLCTSPLQMTGLDDGEHSLRVRAINEMDNFDPTPAYWRFTVDTTPPVVTIDSGPQGKTEDRRPEFTFSSNEPGSTFQCRFDSAPLGDCVGADWDEPASDLPNGQHGFTVQATDRAGNKSPEVSRDFEVVTSVNPPPPPPPPPPGAASLKLGKPKMNRKKGFILLPATSLVAGKVKLARTKLVKPQSKPVKAGGTVKLKVRAKGKALKKLKRRGKVRVTAKVSLFGQEGERANKSRKLTLKKKKAKKKGR